MTSSTIARWLRTCLSEAGIDTGIFKTHSVRGAASSKPVAVGVTTADILQATDWSSVNTFQKFYLHSTQKLRNHLSFGKEVLVSVRTSNLHVDMETEPSKCNFQMGQGTQCLHAIRNYMRKVKLKYQHSFPPSLIM